MTCSAPCCNSRRTTLSLALVTASPRSSMYKASLLLADVDSRVGRRQGSFGDSELWNVLQGKNHFFFFFIPKWISGPRITYARSGSTNWRVTLAFATTKERPWSPSAVLVGSSPAMTTKSRFRCCRSLLSRFPVSTFLLLLLPFFLASRSRAARAAANVRRLLAILSALYRTDLRFHSKTDKELVAEEKDSFLFAQNRSRWVARARYRNHEKSPRRVSRELLQRSWRVVDTIELW